MIIRKFARVSLSIRITEVSRGFFRTFVIYWLDDGDERHLVREEERITRQRRTRGTSSHTFVLLTISSTFVHAHLTRNKYIVSTHNWFTDTIWSRYYTRGRNFGVIRN